MASSHSFFCCSFVYVSKKNDNYSDYSNAKLYSWLAEDVECIFGRCMWRGMQNALSKRHLNDSMTIGFEFFFFFWNGWIYHKYLQSYMKILSWIDMLNKGVELNVKNHPKLFLLPVPPSDIHINTYVFQWIVFKLQYLICKEWQIFLGYKQFLPNIRIPFWEIWIIEFCHTENGRWRHWRIFYYRGEGSSVCITVHSIFQEGNPQTTVLYIPLTDPTNRRMLFDGHKQKLCGMRFYSILP